MSTGMSSLLVALLALAPVATPGATPGATPSAAPAIGSVSIALDRNLYQGGESVTLSITGTPGDVPFVLIDGAPGSW